MLADSQRLAALGYLLDLVRVEAEEQATPKFGRGSNRESNKVA